MTLEDRKNWWDVLELPFCDYGTPRLPPSVHLCYFFGSKADAERAGRRHPAHDSWGDVTVRPVYLEDVMAEIETTEAVIEHNQKRLQELLAIRAHTAKRMGL